MLIASLIIQLLALGTPLFTQTIIDKVIVHRTESTLIVIGIGLAVFMIFSAILSWVRQAGGSDASALPPANATALNAQERQELIELRRKLRQVQIERDILAKATAWFAAKSDKTFTPSTHS